MTSYQILYWHNIPLQVRAGGRRDRVSVELPPRFQEAVDSAAMAAGLAGAERRLLGCVWGEAQGRDGCILFTSPSSRGRTRSRLTSSV